MRSTAFARFEHRHGRTELIERRAETPIGWYWCDGRALIASSAAHPVGGDELAVDVVVGPDAVADVGTVAASVVWPGPHADASEMRTRCTIDERGHLHLHPEPTVAVVGADHRAITRITLASGATCSVVEEVSLGRTDEPSGRIAISLRIERDGVPLLHHDERFGDGLPATSVSVGNARHVLTAAFVGSPAPAADTIIEGGAAAGILPVGDDVSVVMAVGTDRPSVLDLVDRLGVDLRGPRPRHGGVSHRVASTA